MRVRINVTGSREIAQALADLGPEAVNSAKFILNQVTEEMVSPIRALAPYEKGALRRSVRKGRVSYRKRSGEVIGSVIAGGGAGPGGAFGEAAPSYANVQERGTWLSGRLAGVRMKHDVGQSPFMDPILLRILPTVPDRVLRRIAAVRRLWALDIRV